MNNKEVARILKDMSNSLNELASILTTDNVEQKDRNENDVAVIKSKSQLKREEAQKETIKDSMPKVVNKPVLPDLSDKKDIELYKYCVGELGLKPEKRQPRKYYVEMIESYYNNLEDMTAEVETEETGYSDDELFKMRPMQLAKVCRENGIECDKTGKKAKFLTLLADAGLYTGDIPEEPKEEAKKEPAKRGRKPKAKVAEEIEELPFTTPEDTWENDCDDTEEWEI